MAARAALIALAALFASANAYDHSGMGTAYSAPYDMDATGQNMCEFNPKKLSDRWNVYYAAMNEADWNKYGGLKEICGKCIEVVGVPGEVAKGHKIKPIVTMIVDQCPSWACDPGNVDFSTSALAAITGYSWDKKKIEWKFVDCDGGGSSSTEEVNDTSAADERAAEKAAAKKAAAKEAAQQQAAARAAASAAAAEEEAAEKAAAEKAAAEKAASEKAARQEAARIAAEQAAAEEAARLAAQKAARKAAREEAARQEAARIAAEQAAAVEASRKIAEQAATAEAARLEAARIAQQKAAAARTAAIQKNKENIASSVTDALEAAEAGDAAKAVTNLAYRTKSSVQDAAAAVNSLAALANSVLDQAELQQTVTSATTTAVTKAAAVTP